MRLEFVLILLLAALNVGCAGTGTQRSSAPSKDEDAAALQVKMGQEYLTKGDLESARDKLQRALELNPNSVDAHTLVAVLNERIRRPEIAEKHYRRAVELKPEDGSVNNNYGVFLCGNGRYLEATKYFQKAVDDPFYKTPAAAFANAGVCANKGGDSAMAEAHFRRALELDSRSLSALYELARLSQRKGESLRARAFIQRYEALSPADAELLALAWQVETRLGDSRNAAAYRERLQKEFPDYALPSDPESQESQ